MIWIVTNEGVGETIYESQVLGQYSLIRELKYDSKIITYHTWWYGFMNTKKRRNLLNSNYDENIISSFWSPFYYLPFSVVYPSIHFLLLFLLSKNKPKVVHCRTEYSVVIVCLVRVFFKVKVVFDCRGDSLAEFDEYFKPKSFLLRLFKVYFIQVLEYRLKFALKLSDVNLFVSEALKQRILRRNSFGYVVPCLPFDNIFYYSEEVRVSWRSQLGFSNKRVILYSGALTGYQNFEYTVNAILQFINDSTVFWVVTNEKRKAEKILGGVLDKVNYKVDTFSFRDMNKVYNAADIGVLLRDGNDTNFVASPTKFFEYCFTGLGVLHNQTVEQVLTITDILGNGIDLKHKCLSKFELIDRKNISDLAITKFSKSNFHNFYNDAYEV
jgi:hypothetical protein